jgi:hypothetical protein
MKKTGMWLAMAVLGCGMTIPALAQGPAGGRQSDRGRMEQTNGRDRQANPARERRMQRRDNRRMQQRHDKERRAEGGRHRMQARPIVYQMR